MSNPYQLLFLGSFLQLLFLSIGCWLLWSRTPQKAKPIFLKRWAENLSLEIINKLSLPILVSFLGFLMAAPKFATQWRIWLPFNEVGFNSARVVFAIVFFDFIFYWRHRAYHLWMKRWHSLHHNDMGYDMSLSLRFHPLENVVNYFIILSGILFLKLSSWEFVLIIQLFAFQALWSHTLKYSTEAPSLKWWDLILVTPKVHWYHHQEGRKESGNFAFLFSIWDRVFGTAIEQTALEEQALRNSERK
jgi:sterol desaturase/sphingolipid hydroxylase (fatty acid hydroxylase superfamily)